MNAYKIKFINKNITPHLVEKWEGKIVSLNQIEPHLKELGEIIVNADTYEIIIYNDYIE